MWILTAVCEHVYVCIILILRIIIALGLEDIKQGHMPLSVKDEAKNQSRLSPQVENRVR
jgi:hypothetical protein